MMTFSIYVPNKSHRFEEAPAILYFLGGLTSTDESARTKSGIYAHVSKYNLVIVFPDSSARNVAIDGFSDSKFLGAGASFYVNATKEKWKNHVNMDTYISSELPELINQYFRVDISKQGITGFSMGGHGALVLHFLHPGTFKSVSAFAPLCNPIQVKQIKEIYGEYFNEFSEGKNYDATELV